MNSKTLSSTIAIGFALTCASSVMAQAPKIEFPAPSPSCTLKQRVGLTDIQVDYSRPGVKGRDVFGGLVPYGKVWRTGANQETKVTFSTPVKLNGTEIPAGTYALLTIPNKDEWTIIINKGSEGWNPFKYDAKDDVVRLKSTPIAFDQPIDAFTIEFNKIREDSSVMNLVWDKTVVPIKVEVSFVDKLVPQIEAVMSSDDPKKPYFQAAQFYYNHGLDLKKASKWVDAAIAERDAHYMEYLKAEILAKQGDKSGAIAAAKHSSELAVKANDLSFVKLNADLITSLQ